MSLDYDLSILTESRPEEIIDLLAKEFRLERSEDGVLTGPAILIGAVNKSERSQTAIDEAFGFRPNVNVWFRINASCSEDEYERGKIAVVKSSMLVLEKISGDAILLFNGENPLLQRLNGDLTLNQQWSWWSADHWLNLISLPYKLCSIASL